MIKDKRIIIVSGEVFQTVCVVEAIELNKMATLWLLISLLLVREVSDISKRKGQKRSVWHWMSMSDDRDRERKPAKVASQW